MIFVKRASVNSVDSVDTVVRVYRRARTCIKNGAFDIRLRAAIGRRFHRKLSIEIKDAILQ